MLRAEIPELEEVLDQVMRVRADDHFPRCCDALKPRRKIGGLAHHRMLTGGAFTEQVAGDDDARRDADSHREIFDTQRSHGGEGANGRKRRAHAALRVVLVRQRKAEMREHAIAQVLGDVAVVARHCADDRILVFADHVAQVFRIEPVRKRGRAYEVHEHDR